MVKNNKAVVFAYHDVGVRCIETLLAHNIEIVLIVSHQDNPHENIWFASVANLAQRYDIPLITPDNPNTPAFVEKIKSLNADWLFSFYYRHMLSKELLNSVNHGALNMHGSLLPHYRGRVPINWAIIHGEKHTGASLHYMVEQPDAGELIGQQSVPILPNDTAVQVFRKVVVAAECLLDQYLPDLLAGTLASSKMDVSAGSYFSGRCAEDGQLDIRQSAWNMHNLIRAVSPPYPGAYLDIEGKRFIFNYSLYTGQKAVGQQARLYWVDQRCYIDACDGERLEIRELMYNEQKMTALSFENTLGAKEYIFKN
jgi:methionyl-tRNA formyltransferase